VQEEAPPSPRGRYVLCWTRRPPPGRAVWGGRPGERETEAEREAEVEGGRRAGEVPEGRAAAPLASLIFLAALGRSVRLEEREE